jgi:hypothetical protein
LKFIQERLRGARREWKEHHLRAAKIREKNLNDLAQDYAILHHASAEKALKAIKKVKKIDMIINKFAALWVTKKTRHH